MITLKSGKSISLLAIEWRCSVVGVVVLLCLGMPIGVAIGQEPVGKLPREVAEVLKRHCVKCHGVAKREGELQLHTALRIWKGGQAGKVVLPHDADKSVLWQRVVKGEMPPEQPLNASEQQVLQTWIAHGAAGLPTNDAQAQAIERDEHWAFTKLQELPLPTVQHAELCRTPIDAWLESELERVELTLSADADRATLLRRIAFSLTGLPPTPTELADFKSDQRPDAVEHWIDHYLQSPQYGVRWGRHWLDAAGYADSNGYFNADSDRPLAYKYRDYVVRAINQDKAFDRFVMEQIAGDELSGFKPDQHRHAATTEMIDMLTATHYLRNGQDGSGESDGNADEVRIDRYTALESSQQIIASSLLGLTLQCAKCHDHKFEPISQLDFYNFQSVLFPAYNPDQWVKPNERVVHASSSSEYEQWHDQLQRVQQCADQLQVDYRRWLQQNRDAQLILFEDDFADSQRLPQTWSATIPGDDTPAGTTEITLRTGEQEDSAALPAALIQDGRLQIIEGGTAGDKWLSTKQVFDWTPEQEGAWIQVTFDLIDNKVRDDEAAAERIGFGIALHDYNNNSAVSGGNVLIDGNPAGGAVVDLDYPGPTVKQLGKIGSAGYTPDHAYGVRITRLPKDKFRLEQLVDMLPDGPHVDLKAADLPNGSFGFEFCCGRSFQVDNVLVEVSQAMAVDGSPSAATDASKRAEEIKRRQSEIQRTRTELNRLRGEEPGRIAWVTDTKPQPPEVFLLARGDYGQRTTQVTPAAFSALADTDNDLNVQPPANATSSGRRLAWARWVTTPDSRAAHLMARVQVNRVWQHHFGTGLVSTPENLGMSGAEPTNAALLDWLAAEFIRQRWSLKAMHRLILSSTAFRQSSLPDDRALEVDPYNIKLWRFPLRRLDAEAIRDAQLAICGELDRQFDGPYTPTVRNGAAEVIVPEDKPGAFRRAIYLQQRRSQTLSMLSVFDAPSMVINCTRRPVTTMPLQSLSLLNSQFAVERGRQLSQRIEHNTNADNELKSSTGATTNDSSLARIEFAFTLVTAHSCTEQQMRDARTFIQEQQQQYAQAGVTEPDAKQKAWADFCQMLLASNAFLYLE